MDYKVIWNPKQGSKFKGSFFTGSKKDCEKYCIDNNGKTGNFYTFVTVKAD